MNPRLYVTAALLPLSALAALLAPALSSFAPSPAAPAPAPAPAADAAAVDASGLHLAARVDRDVVYSGDRTVRVKLELSADPGHGLAVPTDLVVVLDRSGSMAGTKILDAQAAARELVAQLGPADRLALVTFASDVRVDVSLGDTARAGAAIDGLLAGGGTDMRAGLARGLALLAPTPGRVQRVVLVSDGLPNEAGGLDELARRAAYAEAPLSTIGIGDDYDEALMERLANQGTGNFLWATRGPDLPNLLAAELSTARETVGSSLVVEVGGGGRLVDAGGIPVDAGRAALGTVFAGQHRSLWLTVAVPAGASGAVDLGEVRASWVRADGTRGTGVVDLPAVQITDDRTVAWSRLGDDWAEAQVNEEYNKVRSAVAAEVKNGNQAGALAAIRGYREATSLVNGYAQNPMVTDNLNQLDALTTEVNSNFEGANQAEKQNLWSKGTRMGSYDARRVGQKKQAP